MSDLNQLCAPIALYPDPLIALLLPASTFPQQIADAARYLQQGGDPNETDDLGWDASVQGLAHYPTVIEWMAANGDWANQLGGAFANEPSAVMDAIQELRRQAMEVGSLVDTPQQQVIEYDGEIQIEPAQQDEICVPEYDPSAVYVAQPGGFDGGGFFHWSAPCAAGVWLNFAFDWHAHAVYTGDWYTYHREHGGWGHPVNYKAVVAGHENGGVNYPANRPGNHFGGWHAPQGAPPAPPQVAASRRGGAVGAAAPGRFAQPGMASGMPSGARHGPAEGNREGTPSYSPRPNYRPEPAQRPASPPAQHEAPSKPVGRPDDDKKR